jgi:hypothetical protein
MAKMAEQSHMSCRLVDDYMRTPPISSSPEIPDRPTSLGIQINSTQQVPTKQVAWPKTSDSVVLILSDDEDEESM